MPVLHWKLIEWKRKLKTAANMGPKYANKESKRWFQNAFWSLKYKTALFDEVNIIESNGSAACHFTKTRL